MRPQTESDDGTVYQSTNADRNGDGVVDSGYAAVPVATEVHDRDGDGVDDRVEDRVDGDDAFVDRDRDGVDDRVEDRVDGGDAFVDRDGDGVDDRDDAAEAHELAADERETAADRHAEAAVEHEEAAYADERAAAEDRSLAVEERADDTDTDSDGVDDDHDGRVDEDRPVTASEADVDEQVGGFRDDEVTEAPEAFPAHERVDQLDDDGVGDEPSDLMPGDVPSVAVPSLWADGQVDTLRERWTGIQLRFLDDPSAAAREAEDLLRDAVDAFAAGIQGRRDQLQAWRTDDVNDTEQLRVAVRGYRDFLERLFTV